MKKDFYDSYNEENTNFKSLKIAGIIALVLIVLLAMGLATHATAECEHDYKFVEYTWGNMKYCTKVEQCTKCGKTTKTPDLLHDFSIPVGNYVAINETKHYASLCMCSVCWGTGYGHVEEDHTWVEGHYEDCGETCKYVGKYCSKCGYKAEPDVITDHEYRYSRTTSINHSKASDCALCGHHEYGFEKHVWMTEDNDYFYEYACESGKCIRYKVCELCLGRDKGEEVEHDCEDIYKEYTGEKDELIHHCKNCNANVLIEFVDHDITYTYTSMSSGSHMMEGTCKNCGNSFMHLEPHTWKMDDDEYHYEYDYIGYDMCFKYRVCDKCGYIPTSIEEGEVMEHKTSVTYKKFNMQYHQAVYHCDNCDQDILVNSVEHDWQKARQEGHTIFYRCSVCGEEYGQQAPHEMKIVDEYEETICDRVYKVTVRCCEYCDEMTVTHEFKEWAPIKAYVGEAYTTEVYPEYRPIRTKEGMVIGFVTLDDGVNFDYYLFSGWVEDSFENVDGWITIEAHAQYEEVVFEWVIANPDRVDVNIVEVEECSRICESHEEFF